MRECLDFLVTMNNRPLETPKSTPLTYLLHIFFIKKDSLERVTLIEELGSLSNIALVMEPREGL
jgi:hypothetical protein